LTDTELVHLHGLHKDLVDDLQIYQTQGGTSQVKPVFTSITFSVTTAPLTDNYLSLSSARHTHNSSPSF